MMPQAQTSDVSRHKCLIYDGHPSEQLPVIVPLLIDGLHERQRCLYLGAPEMVQMVDSALVTKGIDTSAETRRGALVFSSDRSHLTDGFDPHAMVGMLTALIDDAVQSGFRGLCATGDMMWELGSERNFARLREYEALLDQLFREKPLNGVCQYHRSTVPSHALQDALLTHRSVYVGDTLNTENHFYLPPEMLLDDGELAEKRGAWMCDQIMRILKAERRRDDALAALRASEAHQRQLADELARMNLDLERRVQERTVDLQAVNRELEAFSYSLSHDLRAPLRRIDGFSDMLLETCSTTLDTNGRALLDRVRTNVHHMNELIEGMLGLARVSNQEINREVVDISAMANEILQELQREAPERQVDCIVAEGLRAFGDRRLLWAVMSNLLGNAWKFTAKVRRARIVVGTEDGMSDRTAFFVGDNGAGFDMKYAQRLFGTFQRLHSEAEFPGTGVGLATVQRIIFRHGGRVWADGCPGEGAKFFFSLPAPV